LVDGILGNIPHKSDDEHDKIRRATTRWVEYCSRCSSELAS